MTMEEIFTLARAQAGGVTSAQFTSANLLKYANIVYKEMQNAIIRRVNENYFYDVLTSDLVNGQNEYTLKTMDGTTIGLKKAITVNVKNKSTDTYLTKLVASSTNHSTQAIDEQKVSPDQESFFMVKDGSIFIYPAPTESITDGLVVEGIVSLIDLVVDGAEGTIFPYNSELRDYHKVLAYGIVPYIYGELKQIDLKMAAKNEYMNELNSMVDELSDRVNNDLEGTLPNGNQYK